MWREINLIISAALLWLMNELIVTLEESVPEAVLNISICTK